MPMPWLRSFGLLLKRYVGRTHEGSEPFHAPPRRTRSAPSLGPVGSVAAAGLYGAYQSPTHSQTLPTTSCSPKVEAPFGNEPTGAVVAKPSSTGYIATSGLSASGCFFP